MLEIKRKWKFSAVFFVLFVKMILGGSVAFLEEPLEALATEESLRELQRQKRSMTTICVEIKPSTPQEEPYYMCKGTDLPFRYKNPKTHDINETFFPSDSSEKGKGNTQVSNENDGSYQSFADGKTKEVESTTVSSANAQESFYRRDPHPYQYAGGKFFNPSQQQQSPSFQPPNKFYENEETKSPTTLPPSFYEPTHDAPGPIPTPLQQAKFFGQHYQSNPYWANSGSAKENSGSTKNIRGPGSGSTTTSYPRDDSEGQRTDLHSLPRFPTSTAPTVSPASTESQWALPTQYGSFSQSIVPYSQYAFPAAQQYPGSASTRDTSDTQSYRVSPEYHPESGRYGQRSGQQYVQQHGHRYGDGSGQQSQGDSYRESRPIQGSTNDYAHQPSYIPPDGAPRASPFESSKVFQQAPSSSPYAYPTVKIQATTSTGNGYFPIPLASPNERPAQFFESQEPMKSRGQIDEDVLGVPNWNFSPDEFKMVGGSEEPIIINEYQSRPQSFQPRSSIPLEHLSDPIMRVFYESLHDYPTELPYKTEQQIRNNLLGESYTSDIETSSAPFKSNENDLCPNSGLSKGYEEQNPSFVENQTPNIFQPIVIALPCCNGPQAPTPLYPNLGMPPPFPPHDPVVGNSLAEFFGFRRPSPFTNFMSMFNSFLGQPNPMMDPQNRLNQPRTPQPLPSPSPLFPALNQLYPGLSPLQPGQNPMMDPPNFLNQPRTPLTPSQQAGFPPLSPLFPGLNQLYPGLSPLHPMYPLLSFPNPYMSSPNSMQTDIPKESTPSSNENVETTLQKPTEDMVAFPNPMKLLSKLPSVVAKVTKTIDDTTKILREDEEEDDEDDTTVGAARDSLEEGSSTTSIKTVDPNSSEEKISSSTSENSAETEPIIASTIASLPASTSARNEFVDPTKRYVDYKSIAKAMAMKSKEGWEKRSSTSPFENDSTTEPLQRLSSSPGTTIKRKYIQSL